MQAKEHSPKRRIPGIFRDRGFRQRSLYDVYMRAIAVTATMDAERHIILAIAFAYVFEVPLPKFEFALRRYKRATLREAAAALV
jgi:hypothetical protein